MKYGHGIDYTHLFCYTWGMKPSGKGLVFSFRELRKFFAAIFKRRVFLLFLLLDGVFYLLQIYTDKFSLTPTYYLGVLFIGFVWSAFQVYLDLSLAYRSKLNTMPVGNKPKSELSVLFPVENRYTYSISDPYEGRNSYITEVQNNRAVESRFDERGIFYINNEIYYVMGKGGLDINIRLHNSGTPALDILSVDFDHNLNLSHLRIADVGVFHHGRKLRYPVHLEGGEIIALQLRYKISINQGSTAGLFAADFRSLPVSIVHEVLFETKDADGKNQTYTSEVKTPSKPLIEMYVKQWQEYRQDEYLVLAVYDLAVKN